MRNVPVPVRPDFLGRGRVHGTGEPEEMERKGRGASEADIYFVKVVARYRQKSQAACKRYEEK